MFMNEEAIMKLHLTALATIAALSFTPVFAQGSGQHSAQSIEHSGQAVGHGSAAVGTGVAAVAAVPLMVVGGTLAVTGSALTSAGADSMQTGAGMSEAAVVPQRTTIIIEPNGAPTLD